MKNYKILTLGTSGAGKTVFLASMFKALSIQKDDSFKIDVEEHKQQKLLNSIYTQVITGDTWPPGTRYSEVSEWTFTCRVQTDTLAQYTACKFTYFDYAGGRLTDVDEDQEVQEIVEQADAILGLLDGQKIHAWISDGNKSLVDSFLQKDLPSILKWMQASTVPIHFVISKWDLLDKDNFSLTKVHEHLLNIPEFKQFVRIRNDLGSLVRLIPVSSVGLNFVIPEPDGRMKKKPGAIPEPFQVEAPIACVLPDRIQQLINESKKKQETLESPSIDEKSNLIKILDYLGIGIGTLAFLGGTRFPEELAFLGGLAFSEELAFLGIGYEQVQLVSKAFSTISFLFKQGIKIINNKNKQDREGSLKSVKDEQTALIHALKIFYDIQNELIERFPQSKVSL